MGRRERERGKEVVRDTETKGGREGGEKEREGEKERAM